MIRSKRLCLYSPRHSGLKLRGGEVVYECQVRKKGAMCLCDLSCSLEMGEGWTGEDVMISQSLSPHGTLSLWEKDPSSL